MTLPIPVASEADVLARLAHSSQSPQSPVWPLSRFFSWLVERAAARAFTVEQMPLAKMDQWSTDSETGNIGHRSGRFFTIEGLKVESDLPWVTNWVQPIIVQPEVGVLGILIKEIGGVLHCLMHAKMEPGNVNVVQLSPTVQATRSNYMGVHAGAAVPYLDYFRPNGRSRVIVDVLQPEQGSWFYQKKNRNIVVETDDDVEVGEDFCWLTLGQLTQLLHWDDIVNMDTRTVLSCIPSAEDVDARGESTLRGEPRSFSEEIRHSFAALQRGHHTLREVLGWLSEQRSRRVVIQRRVPLRQIDDGGWRRSDELIAHESGRYFQVVGVDVVAGGREVGSWQQPLLAPIETGLLALIARRVDGLLHVLVQARIEAGSPNAVEMAPTVHCQPINYQDRPPEARPRFLDAVLDAPAESIRYDVIQSEEGGRFFHARNRCMVVEVGDDFPLEAPDHYMWATLGQLSALLSHGSYMNVELRTLVACAKALGQRS
ncbi:MAG: NDP-hexose 2,3-dehydratase family protein [Myxococcota bacterium]